MNNKSFSSNSSKLRPSRTVRQRRAKKFTTISSRSAAIIRGHVHAGYRRNVGAGTIFEIGRVEIQESSGRIRCRQCAQNIAKGEQSIRFFTNLNVESDSYFSHDCALHYEDCCPPAK